MHTGTKQILFWSKSSIVVTSWKIEIIFSVINRIKKVSMSLWFEEFFSLDNQCETWQIISLVNVLTYRCLHFSIALLHSSQMIPPGEIAPSERSPPDKSPLDNSPLVKSSLRRFLSGELPPRRILPTESSPQESSPPRRIPPRKIHYVIQYLKLSTSFMMF